MAAVYAQPVNALHNLRQQPHHAQQHQSIHQSPQPRRTVSKQRFLAEFSQCLVDFVIQLLPTPEELAVKENVRRLLERLIRTIEPDSRLLQFGSTANGFSLRNSDMDLCCLIDSDERLNACDLVTMLGDLLERETKFHVKSLPHARIPIVKLSLDASPGLPFGIACDIGFENRLALENTRLLMCYAMIDPARVRTMVLFLKVWCKRRKINSPYKGTLSSYGYVLLVIFFLVHVKNPPVLPNLQQMPPLRPISPEESHLNGHNTWFFDDINLLRQRWQSSNTESVAELLVDFFRYYAREFSYNTGVASIRAGLLKKDSKGWNSDADRGTARERNRLCIEDPFETDFNVARCVTKDGLYTIRGELMRASRILAVRPDRAIVALSQLCEERKDEELLQASPSRPSFAPPRLAPLPPQTPYTVGSKSMRPPGAPPPDRLSPPQLHETPSSLQPQTVIKLSPDRLEHMAPKRAKWTSPPPPEAPATDRSTFEDRLGKGLVLATLSNARESERDTASSTNSEILTDEEGRSDIAESDEVTSIKSFNEEGSFRYPSALPASLPVSVPMAIARPFVRDPSSSSNGSLLPLLQAAQAEGGIDPRMLVRLRGRPSRVPDIPMDSVTPVPGRGSLRQQQIQSQAQVQSESVTPQRIDAPRRSLSGPPPRSSGRLSMPVLPGMIHSPTTTYPSRAQMVHQLNAQHRGGSVFYETPVRDRLSRNMIAVQSANQVTYGVPQAVNPLDPTVRQRMGLAFGTLHRASSSSQHILTDAAGGVGEAELIAISNSSTPSPPDVHQQQQHTRLHSHSHSHSATTITALTPPPSYIGLPYASPHGRTSSPSQSRSRSPRTSSSPHTPSLELSEPPVTAQDFRSMSPMASVSSESAGSPPSMSCSSSQYAVSVSPLSTSPSPTTSEALGRHGMKLPQPPPPSFQKIPIPEVPPIPSEVVEFIPSPGSDGPRIAVAEGDLDELLSASTETLSLGP